MRGWRTSVSSCEWWWCEGGHLEPGPMESKDRLLSFRTKEDHTLRRKARVCWGLEPGAILLMKPDMMGPGWASRVVRAASHYAKVVGSIPDQGTYKKQPTNV